MVTLASPPTLSYATTIWEKVGHIATVVPMGLVVTVTDSVRNSRSRSGLRVTCKAGLPAASQVRTRRAWAGTVSIQAQISSERMDAPALSAASTYSTVPPAALVSRPNSPAAGRWVVDPDGDPVAA